MPDFPTIITAPVIKFIGFAKHVDRLTAGSRHPLLQMKSTVDVTAPGKVTRSSTQDWPYEMSTASYSLSVQWGPIT